MSTAKKVVDSLIGPEERGRERERKLALIDIRKTYGSYKKEPDARQAVVLRRLWMADKHIRFMDYCRKHGLNPNHVIAGI